MAGASLLTLLDDISTILDDVALMSKVAAKKTAGVLGDDLALNAQQLTGFKAERELPIVWAVAKGSFINKVILVPLALLISAFWEQGVVLLLMLGGLYLCYEGVEKLVHSFFHRKHKEVQVNTISDGPAAETKAEMDIENLAQFEKEKTRGAIRTDFILSAEIIVISLGTVATVSLLDQLLVLSVIAVLMTVGVYGLVAGIVKLDDAGLYLMKKPGQLAQKIGQGLLSFAPYLMKTLSIVGTVAMFLVGGGIIAHGIPLFHHWIDDSAAQVGGIPGFGQLFEALLPTLLNGLIGIMAGILVLAIVSLGQKFWSAVRA
jgi:predicted DNA repair protein MutK